MSAASEITGALLPLALLVAGGAALVRFGFYDDGFRRGLDRLVYWVALPALIVGVLAGAPAAGVLGSVGRMAGVMCGATLLMAALVWGLAAALRRPGGEAGVLAQAAFRGNLAFVGLPVIALATGADEAVLAKAALVLAPTVVLYNVLAVAGLVGSQQRLSWALPWRMLRELAVNPLLLACVAGLTLWAAGVRIPGAVDASLGLLGATAGPLALLSLGGALVVRPVTRRVAGVAAWAAGLKCAAMPALVWGLSAAAGLGVDERLVVMVFGACPTAVASYVLAAQLRGDTALAAAAVVLSTLASGVGLGVVLAVV
ncbi:MAG: AEC family transporter [Planctomycetota bacterium]